MSRITGIVVRGLVISIARTFGGSAYGSNVIVLPISWLAHRLVVEVIILADPSYDHLAVMAASTLHG